MKIEIKIKFCQNLSKFQDRIEESRRENGKSGEDSQPLRNTFYAKQKHSNIYPPKLPQLLLKSVSYITGKAKPFQDMTISLGWLFLFFGGVLVVFFVVGN
jgi:hypothetical protein